MKKCIRVIEIVGEDDWVDRTLARAISGSMSIGTHGTITELFRSDVLVFRSFDTPSPIGEIERLEAMLGVKLTEQQKKLIQNPSPDILERAGKLVGKTMFVLDEEPLDTPEKLQKVWEFFHRDLTPNHVVNDASSEAAVTPEACPVSGDLKAPGCCSE